jgi:hypothetical protein
MGTIVFLVVFDGVVFKSSSHAAGVFNLIKGDNLLEVKNIIIRKVGMNIHNLRYTAWTEVVVTMLLVIPTLLARQAGATMKNLSQKYPNMVAGLIGISAGSAAGFMFNDSGVVPAATCLLFAASALLYVIIDERNLSPKGV